MGLVIQEDAFVLQATEYDSSVSVRYRENSSICVGHAKQSRY
jgi:hypothetical protein